VMNYGYGQSMPWLSYNPFFTPWSWGGFGGFGGYGTFPYSAGFGFPAYGYGWPAANDDEIRYFVEQSLNNDPSIPPHVNIGVDVHNGVVTLTGTVPNKRIKHAAGDDAWWIPQVLDVHNEINVVSRRERAGTGETETGTATGRRGQTATR
jgi:hypothetical protein